MVKIKEWKEFEENTIKRFYIYGAGEIYKKIVPVIKDRIICVLDMNYKNIKKIEPEIKINSPDIISEIHEKDIHILCCLNPYKDYKKRTLEVAQHLSKFTDKIIFLYCLDIEEIISNGVINWEGQELLINNLTCLTSKKRWEEYMKYIYKEKDHEYIKKLYEEPTDYIWNGNGIGLRDFNNGYIVHRNGKKITIREEGQDKYNRNIWCFGDSRVSGMLNENKHTFASFLQKK